ncbi:lipopolysaccharide biosynthesis protein [Allohahella marinimesophila]|uniref:Oligosaccharide flippase family protein n=1 Tax=Allohahella marinimesophila TaxID=1054972 RepID=A0ABP7Q7Q1_9GAMM
MASAVSQTSLYTIANILRHISSLIMLPIYTRYLTPSDYGTVELMTMALDFTGIIVCNRIGEAIFRYYSLAETSGEKKQIMSTAFFLGVGINALGFMILILGSPWLSDFVSDQPDFQSLFILFAAVLIFEALTTIPIIYMRLRNKAQAYLVVSVIKLSLQLSFSLYFVVYKELHVEGVIYSAFLSNLIVGTILSIYLLKNTGVRFMPAVAWKIFKFSLPMVFVASASFVTTFGDRFFLRQYGNLEDVGIYSLAYKFGFLFVALAWDPFFKFWEGRRYEVYKDEDGRDLHFGNMFRRINAYVLFIALGFCAFIPEVIQLMAAPEFWDAAYYAPFIVFSFVFYAWTMYFNFGIFLHEKTKLLAYCEIISAVIITSLYALLIPSYGLAGAVASTFLGYVIKFILVYFTAQKLFTVKGNWGETLPLAVIAGTMVYVFSFFHELSLQNVAIKAALIFCFAVYTWRIVLQSSDKAEAIALICAIFRRLSGRSV